MELFEFNDTFCCSLWNESKYNTSKRPNLLGTVFNDSIIINCTFIAKNNGKKQYIFAKPGLVNSGVYIDNNKLKCVLFTANPESGNFSDDMHIEEFDFEYDKEYKVIYQIQNVEGISIFLVSVNGEKRMVKCKYKTCDYAHVPLWIGVMNPFLKDTNEKYYFNGIISEFIVSNNEGIVTNLDFTKVNRFKVWDKSGNGNFAYIEEFMNKTIQIKLNKLLAGNSLETADITNIKQTLI